MLKYGFWITILTQDFNGEYEPSTEVMQKAISDVVLDKERIVDMTHDALSGCHSEVEIMLHQKQLLGRIVIIFTSESKVQLDKNKLRKYIMSALPWKVKIEKRALKDSELEDTLAAEVLSG